MTEARVTIEAAGYPFSALTWGDADGRPLLLIHGVTASAEIWWRVGPALARTGRRVVAVDLPGHGRTDHWRGRLRFAETAADVMAFSRAAGLDRPDLQVIAHSWGAMVGACLPAIGLKPATLVLLEPPALPQSLIARMAGDPSWGPYASLDDAVAAVAAANPTWTAEDVAACARGLLAFEPDAARSIVLQNGDWDAGLGALGPSHPAVDVWVIRGEPSAGGLTLDWAADAYRARLGDDHVITIPGAPHSPQRTHLDALLAAFRPALGD